jgi:hypothetical protein
LNRSASHRPTAGRRADLRWRGLANAHRDAAGAGIDDWMGSRRIEVYESNSLRSSGSTNQSLNKSIHGGFEHGGGGLYLSARILQYARQQF